MNKKKRPDPGDGGQPSWEGPPIAVFWDQSLVWGLICMETLEGIGVPCHLLSAADIVSGRLEGYKVLLVPGGWASHKVRALGEEGRDRIKEFIEGGGSYLGFCGGAGLALSSTPSLGIVPLERLSLSERLPNASGEIWIKGAADHPAWKDLPGFIPVSIWWPSQFRWEPLPGSLRLADYQTTGADFWVADSLVSDLEDHHISWEEWEKIYGINLNPKRLFGHPAIIEVPSGMGRLVLSYPHLETPDDRWGNRLLLNLLVYLDQGAAPLLPENRSRTGPGRESPLDAPPGPKALDHLMAASDHAEDLIRFGERQLLWRWRNSWLLHWRRGIRGLEYGTLAVSLRWLVAEAQEFAIHQHRGSTDPWLEPAKKLEKDVQTFCRLAQRLLLEEKLATQAGNLKKLGKVNDTVDLLRERIFGNKMNHGGLCGELFDELDRLLFHILGQHTAAGVRAEVG
jgi:hypothetical protein